MPSPTGRRTTDKPEIQDARWGKVFAAKPATSADYSTLECRAMRNEFNAQNKNYVPGEWGVLQAAGMLFIARKQIGHHSTQIYLAVVEGQLAKHYLITEKCAWKRAGNATPTADELKAWSKFYG